GLRQRPIPRGPAGPLGRPDRRRRPRGEGRSKREPVAMIQRPGDASPIGESEAGDNEFGPPTNGLGLLANGSSRRWDVAVDESLDRDEWSFEIEGPQTYLVFQLQDLNVIPAALAFLRAGPR